MAEDGIESASSSVQTDKCPRWPFALMAIAGVLCVLGAVIVTPSFVLAHYHTPKGSVDPANLNVLDQFRIIAAVLGTLLLINAVVIPLNYRAFRRAIIASQLPWGTILLLVIVWAVLLAVNLVLRGIGIETGAIYFFPIDLFRPAAHFTGIPYAILFVAILIWFAVYKPPANALQTWLVGLALIVLGNLMQGGFDAGFYRPFTIGDEEYYHEAIKITDWQNWINQFNEVQPQLLNHSKSHPPFAVLSHYALLNLPGGLTTLSLSFVFISSTAILLVCRILRSFDVDRLRVAQMGLLYSVLPAVNIYSVVCLDAVIATFATLALLGMVLILREQNLRIGIPAFLVGLLCTNALTFGALFLWVAALIFACFEWYRFRRPYLALAIGIAAGICVCAHFLMLYFFNYNHLQAFRTVSHLENPNGFRGFAEPVRYIGSRMMDVGELAVCLSLGVLAVLLQRAKSISWTDQRSFTGDFYCVVACAILLAMFLTGAFKTGETARPCLFFYPYAMLMLINESPVVLRSLTLFAGFQTAIMQLFGDYHW